MIYFLTFMAFLIVFGLGFATGYLPNRRTTQFNDDLLDRLAFRDPGDYLIMKYQRQKLNAERKNWWGKKEEPQIHPDDTLRIEKDKAAQEQLKKEQEARDKVVLLMKAKKSQREEFVKAGQEPPL